MSDDGDRPSRSRVGPGRRRALPLLGPGSSTASRPFQRTPDLPLPRVRERRTRPADDAPQPALPPVKGPLPHDNEPPRPPGLPCSSSTTATTTTSPPLRLSETGEVLHALAGTAATHPRDAGCGGCFRARVLIAHPRRTRPRPRPHQAAGDLVHSGPARRGGEDGATTAIVLDMQFLAVAAATCHAKEAPRPASGSRHQAADTCAPPTKPPLNRPWQRSSSRAPGCPSPCDGSG